MPPVAEITMPPRTDTARAPLLVITGFMGTGKSAVGRTVASALGLAFVDMDELIQAREQQQIREIFEQKGEAYFRAVESDLVLEISNRQGLVVATGGGTLVNPLHQRLLSDQCVICLDASVEELVRRLGAADNRPLLSRGPGRERIVQLLQERSTAYAQIERHVDTTGKSINSVAEQVIAVYREFANQGRGDA